MTLTSNNIETTTGCTDPREVFALWQGGRWKGKRHGPTR